MQDLVVIDEAKLLMMMGDRRFVQLLPCLGATATQLKHLPRRGCPSCLRTQVTETRSTIIATAKRCVAGSRGQRLLDLKALLAANKLRIHAPNARGQTIKWTL